MKKLATFLLITSIAGLSAYAQTVWVGDQDANWFTDNAGNTNWAGDVIPNGISSQVEFDATSTTPDPLNITVNSDVTVGDFIYSAAPSNITLSGTGVLTMDDGTGSNNFLNGTQNSRTFTVNNNMVFTSGQSSMINFNSRGTITLNGDISGVAGVRKTGLGDLRLTGNNSYTGTTRIDANNLVINTANALGSSLIQWNVAGGSAANLVIENTTTITNDLNFNNGGGAGDSRIRSAGGNITTFTTNSITADAGEEMELLLQGGTGTATDRFTGTSLTTDVNINLNNDSNTLELAPASGTQTWSGVIRSENGSGSVVKSGNGTVTLSGDNTYIGTTTVSAGTLWINGATSGQGAFTVDSGATLGGTGTIGTLDADVTINGILSAGNSPGTLTMALGTGTLDVSASESLVFELGTISDQVALSTGSLTIGGGVIDFASFAFSDSGGLTAGTYTLFDTTTSINGTLSGSNLSGAIGSFTGTLGLADGGNDLVLNVIPEPSSLALIGIALGALALFRRRK